MERAQTSMWKAKVASVPSKHSTPEAGSPRNTSRAWPKGFLASCVPLDPNLPGNSSSVLPPNVLTSTDIDRVITAADDAALAQTPLLQVLQHIAQLSCETAGEIRSLKHQVGSLEGEVRNFIASDAAQSSFKPATLPAVQEIRALQQQVNAVEEALRRYFALQPHTEKHNQQQTANIQPAICGLEERLERRLALLQQADSEILQRCNNIQQSIESLASSSDRPVFSDTSQQATSLLMNNVEDIDDTETTVPHRNISAKSLCTAGSESWETPGHSKVSDLVGLSFQMTGMKSSLDDEEKRDDRIDNVTFALILLDVVFVGVDASLTMQNIVEQERSLTWLHAIQLCLGMAFSTELAVRVYRHRRAFFVGPGAAWNYFDVFITVFSVLNAILELAVGGSLGHLTFLRVFRVLRVLRAAHVIRSLKDFYTCRLIMDCLSHVIFPTFWVFTMLLFALYVSAIVLLQMLDVFISAKPTAEIVDHYGSLGNAIFTLYLSVTGGLDWQKALEPLLVISGWFRLFFIMFVGFMHFGMFNIYSAIFVAFVTTFVKQHHQESLHNSWSKDSAVIEELRQIMTTENARDDDRITFKRLTRILQDKGITHLKKVGLDINAVLGVFNMLDAEETGTVLVDEIACSLMQLKGNTENVHFATVMYENKRLMNSINQLFRYIRSEFTGMKQR